MLVTGTEAAARVVDRARRDRRGALVFTIGTGCCESTAPFLYDDFWPGPDQAVVGDVGGVPVYAPEYLRRLYPGDDGVVIDVIHDLLAESLSVETEYSCRFVLRSREGHVIAGQDVPEPAGEPAAARAASRPAAPVPEQVSALRPRGRQELPEALRGRRLR